MEKGIKQIQKSRESGKFTCLFYPSEYSATEKNPYLQVILPSFQKSDVCSSDRYLLDHPRAQRGQKLLHFLSALAYEQHWRTDLMKYNKTHMYF